MKKLIILITLLILVLNLSACSVKTTLTQLPISTSTQDENDVKDSKDLIDVKDAKDAKDGKDRKDANDAKDVNDVKDGNNIKDVKGVKVVKGYGEKILNSDEQDCLLDILDIIYEKCGYGENLAILTNGEKVTYLIGEVEGEVNDGGFIQYFFNSSGMNAQDAINALKEINANYTASLLEQAMVIYKNGPTNNELNISLEEELTVEQNEQLSELDEKFFQYKDNLDELQIKYIKKHLNEFY